MNDEQCSEKIAGDLRAFFSQVETLAADTKPSPGSTLVLPTTDVTSDDWSETAFGEYEAEGGAPEPDGLPPAYRYQFAPKARPVVAVDCGAVQLGEVRDESGVGGGVLIALRASVVTTGEKTYLRRLRTGAIYLPYSRRTEILYEIGVLLGKADFFIKLRTDASGQATPTALKSGAADNAHQYSDRLRAFFERMAQLIAVEAVEGGTVLLDHSLTLRSRDTPDVFFRRLGRTASRNGNDLIGISKHSKVQVAGKPIRFWLSDVPEEPCYRLLSPLMDWKDKMDISPQRRANRIMGNVYATRFSPRGETFRMDVMAASGRSEREAIETFFAGSLMRAGYPDALVAAHAHSFFPSATLACLRAQAAAEYGCHTEPDVALTGIFAPFGGRFK